MWVDVNETRNYNPVAAEPIMGKYTKLYKQFLSNDFNKISDEIELFLKTNPNYESSKDIKHGNSNQTYFALFKRVDEISTNKMCEV